MLQPTVYLDALSFLIIVHDYQLHKLNRMVGTVK